VAFWSVGCLKLPLKKKERGRKERIFGFKLKRGKINKKKKKKQTVKLILTALKERLRRGKQKIWIRKVLGKKTVVRVSTPSTP